MTAPSTLKYPSEATNAAWQKKKSFLDKAKAKTKTGLGEELTKLQAKWNEVKFTKLDVTKVGLEMGASSHLVGVKRDEAETEFNKIAALKLEVDTVAKKAKTVAAVKGLSKDAATAANLIAAKLTSLHNELGKVDLKDFDEALKKAETREENTLKLLKENYAELQRALIDLQKNPTLIRWEQRDVQSIDMIRRILSGDSRFARVKDSWKDLSSDMHHKITVLTLPGAKRDKQQEKQAILQLVKRVDDGMSVLKEAPWMH